MNVDVKGNEKKSILQLENYSSKISKILFEIEI